MVTEAQVREALRSVNDPEIGKPIEDIGMLDRIEVDGGRVRVHVLLTIEGCPLRDRITQDVTAAVAAARGRRARGGQPHPDERGAARAARRAAPRRRRRRDRRGSRSRRQTSIIAVASGKGGVGKSSVTVNLACALAAEGANVGVLDADVWGFSIPRMLGAEGKPVGFNDMILPLEAHGVKVISMGFFVPEETPVIWRGPDAPQGDRAVPGRRLLGRPRLPALRPPARDRRREHLARLVPAGGLDARRDDAAGRRAHGRRARREDGRAHEPAGDRRRREHELLPVPPLRRARPDLRRRRRAGSRPRRSACR